MIDFLRRQRNSITGALVLAFAVLLMVSFGMDTPNFGKANGPAIRVNSEEISHQTYTNHYNQLTGMYRRQLGENFENFKGFLNLEQRTVDSLITERLLADFANRAGIGVGLKQVEAEIAQNPYFDGSVDAESFREYLRAMGMSEAQLEGSIRKDLIQKQLLTTLSDLDEQSEQELRAVFFAEQQKARFSYVKLTPAQFEQSVTVDDAELGEYYEKNKQRYELPLAVKITYTKFSPAEYADKVQVPEEDIVAAYNERQLQLTEPAQILLRQIVIKRDLPKKEEKDALQKLLPGADKVPDQKQTEEEASKLSPDDKKKGDALRILERARAGEDFKKLVSETSEDKASVEKEGSLGWLEYKKLPPSLRSAADKLLVGEVSDLITAPDGFYILRADDIRPERLKPIEEVRAQLVADLKQVDAPVYMEAAVQELYDRLRSDTGAFKEFLEKDGRKVETTPVFISVLETGGLPTRVIERALRLSKEEREMISLDDGIYIIEVSEVREARVPPLADVRDAVTRDFRLAKAGDLLKSFVEEFEKKPSSLEEISATKGVPIAETKLQTRNNATEEFLAQPENKALAFGLTKEKPALGKPLPLQNNFYFVRLLERVDATEEEFKKEKDALRLRERQEAGTRLLMALSEVLRSKSDVWVDPEILGKSAPTQDL